MKQAQKNRMLWRLCGPLLLVSAESVLACDRDCLVALGHDYLDAYAAQAPGRLSLAEELRYTENNVEMPFPDGTWDTVSEEYGPRLVLADPDSGQIALFTAIRQNDIPGFLAVRAKLEEGAFTEVEHIISTRRNLSSPPTPIGEVEEYVHEPMITEPIPEDRRLSREALIAHADGYFQTLEMNDGEIRGTCFLPEATRRENGMLFEDIEGGFRSGRYRFNNRVRREHLMVDEHIGVVLSRGFIDHKGQLVDFELTDGTPHRSIFREPQTWGFLEMFKVEDDCIAAVVATFYQAPYYTRSPWTQGPDR